MRLELNLNGDSSRSHIMEAMSPGIPKMPRTHVLDQLLMYAERGLMVYALFRLANSENFQEMLKNRY